VLHLVGILFPHTGHSTIRLLNSDIRQVLRKVTTAKSGKCVYPQFINSGLNSFDLQDYWPNMSVFQSFDSRHIDPADLTSALFTNTVPKTYNTTSSIQVVYSSLYMCCVKTVFWTRKIHTLSAFQIHLNTILHFFIIKPTRCTNFTIFHDTLHVSDSSTLHHREFFTVHSAMGTG